jgi:hypothetical protein
MFFIDVAGNSFATFLCCIPTLRADQYHYPTITTGFAVLNYLLITALLVILAATAVTSSLARIFPLEVY